MATVVPYRRPRRGPAQRLSAPGLPRPRRTPVTWLVRYFGLIALAVAATLMLRDSGLDRPGDATRQASAPAGVSSTLAGHPTVVDGDTLRLDGERIRIIGIDAPETQQSCTDAGGRPWACGHAATQKLNALIAGGRVACTARGRDVYGRTLATCSASEVGDLGGAMVRDGFALNDSGYLPAEADARLHKRGLWAGEFERPQDWRRQHRQ